MNARGIYRGIYSAMLDDPDYQRLTPRSRHVLLTLRLCSQNTIASVFRLYLETLAVQTGYSVRHVAAALDELEKATWIVRDGPIVWIRNGLKFDPNVRIADKKHRKGIERALALVPSETIAVSFREYYDLEAPPKGLASPSQGSSKPSLRGSKGAKGAKVLPPTPLRGDAQQPPNGPRRYPPELFHADCPDPTWRGQCVDRAYVDAHAAELGGHYPVLPDGSGGYRPRSCEAHR